MKNYLIVFLLGLACGFLADKMVDRFTPPEPDNQESKSAAIIRKYHIIEVLTAIIVTTLFIRFDATIYFVSFTFLFTILVAVFFIDTKYRIIPNKLVIAAIIGGLVMAAINIIRPLNEIYGYEKWWAPIAGFFSGSGLLLFVAVLGKIIYKTDDAMGMGDVKLMAPIGLFFGWRLCLLSLSVSIIIAGTVSVLLVILKLKGRKDTIPFGPFIAIGAYATIMLSGI